MHQVSTVSHSTFPFLLSSNCFELNQSLMPLCLIYLFNISLPEWLGNSLFISVRVIRQNRDAYCTGGLHSPVASIQTQVLVSSEAGSNPAPIMPLDVLAPRPHCRAGRPRALQEQLILWQIPFFLPLPARPQQKSSAVVQWFGYLAFTQETRVQPPAAGGGFLKVPQ